MKPDLKRPVDFTTYNGTDNVCTRDGRAWRSLGEIKSSFFAIVGAMLHSNGFETAYVWSEKGRKNDSEERGTDLFYALPEKVEKTFWILVTNAEIKNKRMSSILYESREEAQPKVHHKSIQIAPITVLVEE